ncbi:MAG: MFS transporter [Xanthomonadales bacterium]|jgi:MFS family permease|nr:MFS transporter [Xanthomonadales bacterium]
MRNVPWPVWRLMLAYALMMGGTALTVLIAGIIGLELAPSPRMATLPIALNVVGVAASTLPTGRLLGRFGRRPVFLAYGVLVIAAALTCALALSAGTFWLYCLGTFFMGWAGAAGHQYRFAALELVPAQQAPQATSVLLLGGILGAFIGPELAVAGRDLLSTPYAGSYLLLLCAYVPGLFLIAGYRDRAPETTDTTDGGRTLGVIFRQPVVLLAVAAAATGYGVMTFLMTATPISMHEHAGHSLESTKWVIQSHIAGMYLPSLVFGVLSSRFGLRAMLWAGVAAYVLTLAVAGWDTALLHYWVALVLLGVGWNFLFLSGTNLLPRGYAPAERFRVQSVNDFLIFSVQAAVSLGSGWVLVQLGWSGVLAVAAVPLVLFVGLLTVGRGARTVGRVSAE